MHSGCFATTPKAAAEVIMAYAFGRFIAQSNRSDGP